MKRKKKNFSDEELLNDLMRVAKALNKDDITLEDLKKHGMASGETYRKRFGGLNEAKKRIGLTVTKEVNIDIEDIFRAFDEFVNTYQREPKTIREVNANFKYSYDPIKNRFGNLKEALKAYNIWKKALMEDEGTTLKSDKSELTRKYTRGEYGEPLNYEELRHAPINELGVVYLFGKVSKDLGFIVEAISASFPDCDAKRKIKGTKNRWERVLIEFEFRSSNFRNHKHPNEGCDIIVCWEHDWKDCPLEVISLKDFVLNKMSVKE